MSNAKTALLIPIKDYQTLLIKGSDAFTFLQGQFTCDINQANSGPIAGVYCDRRGKVLCRLWIYQQNDTFRVLTLSSNIPTLIKTLKRYVLFSKVSIEPAEKTHFFGVINNIGFTIPSSTAITWNIAPHLTLLEIAEESTTTIIQQLEKTHALTQDQNAWALALIKAKHADISPQTALQFTPQMLGVDKTSGLCFNKGCYIGQEVIARTEHLGKVKRQVIIAKWKKDDTITINPGDPIKDNHGVTVGTLLQYCAIQESEYLGLVCIQIKALEQNLLLNTQPVTLIEG
jgi:tRNA-modifying protein YgfZ